MLEYTYIKITGRISGYEMFDCHVHTCFSGDSRMIAKDACDYAINHSLKGIAFTDHLDYDFPGLNDTYLMDFDKYSSFMDALKDEYKNRLKVIKGVEVGLQPHVVKKTIEKLSHYSFDYIIGSVHIIAGADPYKDEFYEGKTKKEAYSRYLEELLYMIDNYNDFDVLGHIDFITRYNPYDDRTLIYDDHRELLDTIFNKLILSGKGIEINTAAFRVKAENDRIPGFDINLIKRYRNLGGEIVCLGSDAHAVDYIGYKFDYFTGILREAGFEYLTYFNDRRPVFEKI